MALFVWQCKKCLHKSRKILNIRPVLGTCSKINNNFPCEGEQEFVSNVASQTMEVIDNGLMAKVLERHTNIEEKMADRKALANKEDDPII